MLHLHLQQEPVDILVAINGHDCVQIISLISNSTSSDLGISDDITMYVTTMYVHPSNYGDSSCCTSQDKNKKFIVIISN